jgi:hypothetical protein
MVNNSKLNIYYLLVLNYLLFTNYYLNPFLPEVFRTWPLGNHRILKVVILKDPLHRLDQPVKISTIIRSNTFITNWHRKDRQSPNDWNRTYKLGHIIMKNIGHHHPLLNARFIDGPWSFSNGLERRWKT